MTGSKMGQNPKIASSIKSIEIKIATKDIINTSGKNSANSN
jgi:hypothetical protein